MTWLFVLTPAALLLFALPWLLEARRRPMTAALRDQAPGRFADLSQGRTHYTWHGPDQTRSLVLVHGLIAPSWVFSGLTRGLVMLGYRVLSYDLHGHGFSDRVAGAQTLAFHTRQLGELLDSLGCDAPVALLGYGMGGAIAAQFAADQSDRVERLILVAPAGIVYRPGRLRALARNGGPLGTWLWGLLGAGTLIRAAAREAKAPTVLPDLPKRISSELSRRGALAAILSSERHALVQPLKAAHREIAAMYIPTLAIWGEADGVVPVRAMGDLARINRQAHQEVIAGAGHGLVHTHPKEVLAAIRDFLRDVPD